MEGNCLEIRLSARPRQLLHPHPYHVLGTAGQVCGAILDREYERGYDELAEHA